MQSKVIDDSSGECRNLGQTSDGTSAFLYLQACKLQVNNAYVGFSVAGVADGPREHDTVGSR